MNKASRVGWSRLQALSLCGTFMFLRGVSLALSTAEATLTVRPFVGVAPTAVADLTALPGTLEGSVALHWTAPAVYPGSTLDSYQLRVQTFSVVDVGGSTTTWWNQASGLLFQSFYGANPGDTVTRIIGLPPADHSAVLEPGASYYFAVRSADGMGTGINFWSDSSGHAAAIAKDLPPTAPAGLSVSSGNAQMTLSWNAVHSADLDFYRLHVDSTAPYDFSDAYLIDVSSVSLSFVQLGLTNGNTYFYFITAIDKGAPHFAGKALESPRSSIVSAAPLPPGCTISGVNLGSGFTLGGNSVTITGTNFDGLSGPNAVTFDGIAASIYTVNASSNVITAMAPRHPLAGPLVEGAVPFTVTTAAGTCSMPYRYALSPVTAVACGDDIFYPSPATGATGTFAYCMALPGTARIRVYNVIGDLAAKLEDSKPDGAQLSSLNTARLAPGVYLYLLEKDYGAGHTVRSGMKKFMVKR